MNQSKRFCRIDLRAGPVVAMLMTAVALALVGCTDGTTAAKNEARENSEGNVQDVDSVADPDVEIDATDKDPTSPSLNSQPNATDAQALDVELADGDEETGEATNAADSQEEALPERVAILAPGGPLLVDLRITLDGRPHDDPLAEILDAALHAADTDGDGKSTWEELVANREYLEGPTIGLAEGDESQSRMWIDQFDYNDDGRLQRGEAAALLGRGTGRTARSLGLRSSRSGYSDPRWNSRIWQLLDVDQSGDLSTGEIQRAATALRARDEDDNQVVTQTELEALIDQLEAASPTMTSSRPVESRTAAITISQTPDVDRLDYLLVNLYSPRQFLGPKSFSAMPALFKSLDESDDEWLSKAELAGLATVEPHLALDVDFPLADESRPSKQSMKVRCTSSELRVLAESEDRIVFALGNTRLIVSLQDFAPTPSAGQQSLRSQIRVMVHDQCDALYEAIDANSDGRLGDREITNCAARLLETDVDGDGRLVSSELPNSMIVAISRAEPPQSERFYVPRTSSAAVAAEAPDWFVAGDFNSDGDVSRREFLGTDEQFARLDGNGDGFVDDKEARGFNSSEEKRP